MVPREEREPRTISKGDYYSLMGLLTLIGENRAAFENLEKASYAILGVKDYDGGGYLLSDRLWDKSFPDLNQILKELNITVDETLPWKERDYGV